MILCNLLLLVRQGQQCCPSQVSAIFPGLKSPCEAFIIDNRDRHHCELTGLEIWFGLVFTMLLLFQMRCLSHMIESLLTAQITTFCFSCSNSLPEENSLLAFLGMCMFLSFALNAVELILVYQKLAAWHKLTTSCTVMFRQWSSFAFSQLFLQIFATLWQLLCIYSRHSNSSYVFFLFLVHMLYGSTSFVSCDKKDLEICWEELITQPQLFQTETLPPLLHYFPYLSRA